MNRLKSIVYVKKYFFILIFLTGIAHAADDHAHFVLSSGSKIPELKWDESSDTQDPVVSVRKDKNSEKKIHYVVLKGVLQGEQKGLVMIQNGLDQTIPQSKDGKFEVQIQINQKNTEFTMNAVDKLGNIVSEQDQISFPQWSKLKQESSSQDELEESLSGNGNHSSKLSWKAGIAVSSVTISETNSLLSNTVKYNEFGLNVQGAVRWNWFKHLKLEGNGSVTVLPISIGTGGNQISFLNLNADAIVPFRMGSSRWIFELIGNYAFKISWVNPSSNFNYVNVQGVTLYPRLKKEFAGGKKIWISAKYLPILGLGAGALFLDSTNHEIDFQMGYRGIQVSHHWIDVVAEANLLSLDTVSALQSITFQGNSYILGLNYKF